MYPSHAKRIGRGVPKLIALLLALACASPALAARKVVLIGDSTSVCDGVGVSVKAAVYSGTGAFAAATKTEHQGLRPSDCSLDIPNAPG